jgi:outer membrane protein assembly complex protein YaeT
MVARASAGALIVLICAASAGAATVDDLPAGEVYELRRVRIEGASGASRRAIRELMLTRPPPWYQPWKRWWDPPAFNPGLFRGDLARVEAWLRESGRFEARLDHDLEVADGALTVVLRIEEGPAVTVRAVTIAAADFVPAPEEERALEGELELAAGDVFTQQVYDRSRQRLERFFLTRGFAYAEVAKAAVVDTGPSLVDVTYTIRRGPPAVFGTTAIGGPEVVVDRAEPVAERLIRRELAYREGEPYDPDKLEETQARIFGLRLFRVVTVRPVNLAERSGVVDVAIEAVEAPPRELQAGIGYGDEDELRGQVRWRHNNYFGGGRQLAFRLKGSSIEQAFEGEFRQPHFLSPRQSLVVPLTQAREDEPGYVVARVRLAPRLERRLSRKVTGAVAYNIEYDELSNVPLETERRIAGFRDRGWVSSLTAVVERNTADDLLDPRRGGVLNLSAEQAGGPWRGDFTFYRAVLDARRYVPVGAGVIAAGRARVGTADGFGQSEDVPVFRRFFAGGINSTRGYDRHLIGPLTPGGSPIGGRSLLEASAEVRVPLPASFEGVAFVDAGEVRLRPLSYSLGDLQWGAGVGLRYKTIVGPLRLDVGFPFDPPPGEPSWRLHFSIGQAF